MFYQLSIATIQETISKAKEKSDIDIYPYWAVAEQESVYCPLWNTFNTIWTGEGGLGSRIYNVLDTMLQQYKNVIIIGSDSPQITFQYIVDAVHVLAEGTEDGVIGPCEDGGFVLFGSKTPIAKQLWTDIEYSKETTLYQLTKKLDKNKFTYSCLPKMGDVDHYDDLKNLYPILKANRNDNLPKQNELITWLETDIIQWQSS